MLLAIAFLRERLTIPALAGLVAALVSLVLFNISDASGDAGTGPWLILAIGILVAWGVQAFFTRKAATIRVNDRTTFAYMTISGLLLIPVAILMMGGFLTDFTWRAPVLTVVLSLAIYQTVPSVYAVIGIVLAIGGSSGSNPSSPSPPADLIP